MESDSVAAQESEQPGCVLRRQCREYGTEFSLFDVN